MEDNDTINERERIIRIIDNEEDEDEESIIKFKKIIKEKIKSRV